MLATNLAVCTRPGSNRGKTVSHETGKLGWIDISVDDAAGLEDFYAAGRFAVIKDPACATAALYEAG